MGVAKEAGQQNLTEDKVPWAELKELATNNLEIIVSVSDATCCTVDEDYHID